jgi:hypothetical protein
MADFLARNWGNLASVAGLVFSILAFVFSKRASVAAREARDAALRRSLNEDMGSAARLAGEVAMYVTTARREMALLRIGDLMIQTRYLDARWQGRLSRKSKDNLLRAHGQLRSMHQLLSVARNLSPDDKARLAMSCQEVSEIFTMELGVANRGIEVGDE